MKVAVTNIRQRTSLRDNKIDSYFNNSSTEFSVAYQM
jgi:hypothetical protein